MPHALFKYRDGNFSATEQTAYAKGYTLTAWFGFESNIHQNVLRYRACAYSFGTG